MYISKFFLALAVAVALISSAFGWEQTHGLAYDVGDGWIIGTTVESGGYGIYRWNSTDWEKISGGAVRIGGTYSNPWIVNEQHIIYHWTGSDWQQMPGTAYDVGDGWIIGTTVENGGYGIYRWNSTDWEKISGGAVRIGGTYSNPWIVNEQHIIYHWTGSDWQQMPGTAYDVGDGWIIGTKVKNGGYGIYRWNGSSWDQIRGSAISIGGAGGPPWIVNNAARIYRW